MDETDALVARAVAEAHAVVQGTTAPHDGARTLWRLHTELRTLVDALTVFVGLASEWEDNAAQRADYERDIVAEADRFIARFGK